ncbi:MAG TPA: transcription-repair coupling factor [Deltaproteobacteria bacterium]|nr:transcription-repair coupling factor [Deltaproteobacteria bacterium]
MAASFLMNIPPEKGFTYLKGRIGSFVSFFVSALHDQKTIIFYDDEDEAFLLKEEIEFFSKNEVHQFPPYSNRVFEKEDESKRIHFLVNLLNKDSFIGLFPARALGHSLFSPERLLKTTLEVEFGDTVYQEDILGYLQSTDYEQVPLVRGPGEYAKRGSIIDIYPPTFSKPVRIEFLGDQVYSLRFFDPVGQRSSEEIERCLVIPAHFEEDPGTTLLDYLIGPTILVHSGLEQLLAHAEDPSLESQLRERFLSLANIDTSGIQSEYEGSVVEAVSNSDLRGVFDTNKTEIFKTLTEKLKDEWSSIPYLYIFALNLHQAERLQEIFRNYDVALPLLKEISYGTKQKEWGILVGPLRRGFRTKGVVLLAEEDIVGPKKRVIKKSSDAADEFLNSFKDLTVGDYVVHLDHGIGVYQGIKKLKIGGYEKDFVLINYQDDDKLYVPVESLELVQKYIGADKARPKIDKLGSQHWRNTKSRVRKQVEDIASELIQFYAERELSKGHVFPPDDELFREMEERFEYEETEGQLRAIEDVLSDLQKPKPMDRVVCGDVGFGKTEVALRATFKAVLDNKQVAILVPTTVLAQQHYNTLRERFRDYPISVEMLSRFRTKEQQKVTAEGLKKGTVDIVVGTHRLLQKDIAFKDLGLIVVDEEHRFGVKAKEQLKLRKKNVDVLTLTATPIPRTLHMALTGIKDLSIINTPPLDRHAVKTHVVKFSDEVIRKGVATELERGGQIFFVHNVIHNIGVVHDHITRLVPEARVAVAHGQMNESQLERIMLDFIDHRYDILLSTNIIESGLDISNVNTIFINNAHRFGLAELYQLRGRVGRGTRQAFSYLLIPKDEVLAKDSLTRLKVIKELTDLGSGFKIANYDLEIRGTGNLLGKEQSGQLNLIGFELYCNMLEDAVKRLRDEAPEEEEWVPEINIPLNAYIPDRYVGDETNKLLTYKRLSKIKDEAELAEMEAETQDRYGPIPEPLRNLLSIIHLRIFLHRVKVKRLECSGKNIVLHITEQTPLMMPKILKMIKEDKGRIKLLPEGQIIIATDALSTDLIETTRNILMQVVAV